MDQPWYRQYFWLLVFGAIIIFAGIISLVILCICRKHFSKRVTMKISMPYRPNRPLKQQQESYMVTKNGICSSSPQQHPVVAAVTSNTRTSQTLTQSRNISSKTQKSNVPLPYVETGKESEQNVAHYAQVKKTTVMKKERETDYENDVTNTIKVASSSNVSSDYEECTQDTCYIDVLSEVQSRSSLVGEYVIPIAEGDEDYDDVEIISDTHKN